MSVLVTRPEHDPTTKYISCWSQAIIDLASSKGIAVFDLRKESANQQELVGRIEKLNPTFVILNGHGDDASVTGHNNEILIQSGNNEHLLYSRITYALSCNSAAVLGVAATQVAVTTYIGYTDEFIFSYKYFTIQFSKIYFLHIYKYSNHILNAIYILLFFKNRYFSFIRK